MPSSPRGRTRTPPDLKWLLNERAAIAGRVQKTELIQRALEARLHRYQLQLEKVLRDLPSVKKNVSAYQTTLQALDTAIGLAYQNVRPDAAGQVNAWAGKYGRRGALIEFVVSLLQEAAPGPVNVSKVTDQVAEHFAIPILCPADRVDLRKSIQSTFKQLRLNGKIDFLHNPLSTAGPGIWRWKQPIPSLSDLAAKAQRMAQAAAEANDARQKPADNPGSAG